jgi:glycosyltransferase involved in cell wall biosynthesis
VRVLAFPHHLEIGGSQVNAVDVARGLRDLGNDVTFFATPGPAGELVRSRGFRLVDAPRPASCPSRAVVGALRDLVRRERFDVVHAWDWPQCLDAYAMAVTGGRVPVVGSIMSMTVTRVVPRSLPLTYGTEALVEQARQRGYRRVMLLEPPVDLSSDDPCAVAARPRRSRWNVRDDEVLVVVVSRLVGWLKLEGLRAAVTAVGLLADRSPVRLVVVGGGSAEPELRERAGRVNAAHGREVVTVNGPMADPRPAYAAADVVIGMGGSAIRGMAFGRPTIVVGESGFARWFDPAGAAYFLRHGMYGTGDGAPLADRLVELLAQRLDDEAGRRELGDWSRSLVRRRFDVATVSRHLEGFLAAAVEAGPPRVDPVEITETLARRLAGVVGSSVQTRYAASRTHPHVPTPEAVR